MSKRLCIPLLLVLCIGNITCATVRYASDQSVEISEDYLGVCPTIRLDDGELDLIESIGARWIRHDFHPVGEHLKYLISASTKG